MSIAGAPLDHVALISADIEATIAALADLGATVHRRGVRAGRPDQPLALLRAGDGTKLEVIHDPGARGTRLAHLAFRVDDVDAAFDSLTAGAFAGERPPYDLPAARARSAMVRHPSGLVVQLIRYDDDSPDR